MPVIKKSAPNNHLTVETVPINSIKFHPKNPIIHNDENLSKIKRSLREFGQRKSIAVWRGYVIAGNGTLMAARDLGWETISISRCDHLTESQAEAYILADNKSGDDHRYDDTLTADLVRSIHNRGDIDLWETGLSEFELDPLLSDTPEDVNNHTEYSTTSEEAQRIIITYNTDDDADAICEALGIDRVSNKSVYTITDCTLI